MGDISLPPFERYKDHDVVRFKEVHPNFLRRALRFGYQLEVGLNHFGKGLKICHFRDPWSGVPILRAVGRQVRTVYEVNGLPSIELPSAFPSVGRETLDKIRDAEEFCWSRANVIITPSQTIADNLISLGVQGTRIEVIPNGAHLVQVVPYLSDQPYLIYFGALQPWQGVDILLKAFARLRDLTDLRLMICSSVKEKRARPLHKLALKLGVSERIDWRYRLSRQELAPLVAGALLSIAPLTECARNLDQGCCPLKILESMALGTPVVASDLPAIREIIEDGKDGKLVRADRPAELSRAIRILLEYPMLRARLGVAARQKVAQEFRWDIILDKLDKVYSKLMDSF